MNYTKEQLFSWCDTQSAEQIILLKTLAAIPAPSHQEDRRAAFIANWLKQQGAEEVIIDKAKNVILPLSCAGKRDIRICMAHTDVVFPDTTELPVREESGRIYAPGVGDDTANVAALMLCAKFFLSQKILPREPMLIVFNSCEEGLGNLKGIRQLMADYAGRIREVVSFDCQSNAIVSRAVGSERWRVTVSTRGGHSFSDFGSPNAIVHLSRLVDQLDRQPIPEKTGCKTTCNVGLISGGTSVNTIAQSGEITYEYRSNDAWCLARMAEQFHRLVEKANCPEAAFTTESLGVRPCGGEVPREAHQALLSRCKAAIREIYDVEVPLCAASTDANIPLSLGIPAATFGLYRGGGAHTREEYVEVDSLLPGLKIALLFTASSLLEYSILDKPFCA